MNEFNFLFIHILSHIFSLVNSKLLLPRLLHFYLLSQKIKKAVDKLLSRESIFLTKVSKKKKKNEYGKFVEVETTNVTDIKPFIYKLEAVENGVFMHLSQGSTNNIKPAFVMDFLEEEGLEGAKRNKYCLYRLDMYTNEGKALDEYGSEII